MSELREALQQAMDKSDSGGSEDVKTSIDRPSNDEVKANADEGMMGDVKSQEDANQERVELGDENPEVKEKSGDEAPQAEEGQKTGDTPSNEPKGDVKAEKTSDKPPVGWTPENREHWAKIPQTVRNQITKREQEVNKVLQDSAQARRFANEFGQTVDPYKTMMASEGAQSPIHAVQSLLQTAATLKMGNKQQRATRMAELIKHYDIDIGTLDSVLAGQQPNNDPKNIDQRVEELVNQRLAPIQQQEQQRQQAQQAQVQQRAKQAISQVSNLEFFNDVRMEMADIVEMATRRGQTITPQEAYKRACHINPEVQKVLRARQAQGLNAKKNAASTVNAKRGGVAQNNAEQSLREQLEANWSASMRG